MMKSAPVYLKTALLCLIKLLLNKTPQCLSKAKHRKKNSHQEMVYLNQKQQCYVFQLGNTYR